MSYINREEAIRLIDEYQGGAMDKPTARKVLEGMDGVEICEDTISRQAAIDTLEKWLYDGDDTRTIAETLYALPSAQPEIIRCKDCKEGTYSSDCTIICKYHNNAFSSDDFCSLAERRTDG